MEEGKQQSMAFPGVGGTRASAEESLMRKRGRNREKPSGISQLSSGLAKGSHASHAPSLNGPAGPALPSWLPGFAGGAEWHSVGGWLGGRGWEVLGVAGQVH